MIYPQSLQGTGKSPTILFRTESFPAIGSGHIMRCLALAQWLRRCGFNVVFQISNRSKTVRSRLLAEGFSVHVSRTRYGGFLDAKETADLADRLRVQWIVLDGYQFDRAYVKWIVSKKRKILFIDDLGGISRRLGNVVLNPNPLVTPSHYGGPSKGIRFLLGTRYALLRHEFWDSPREKRPRRNKCRVLVTLGGSDPFDTTRCVLRAILGKTKVPLDVTVIIGPLNQNKRFRERVAKNRQIQIRFVRDARNMAKWMAWADLAISSAGGTSWELARMGCPMILLVLAENQAWVAKALVQKGAAHGVGWIAGKEIPRLAALVDSLAGSSIRRRTMALRGRRLVDGKGCARVARALRTMMTPVNVSNKPGKGIL